jgi:hypothetical protein
MQTTLPAKVQSTLGSLLGELELVGARPIKVELYPGFGDSIVSFVAGSQGFDIVRDRGQLMVQGPGREELQRAGLWKAFNDVAELRAPLLSWVRREDVAQR